MNATNEHLAPRTLRPTPPIVAALGYAGIRAAVSCIDVCRIDILHNPLTVSRDLPRGLVQHLQAPAAAAKDGPSPSAAPAREQPPQPQAATATAPGANAGQDKAASSQPGRSLLSNNTLLRKLAAANTFIDVADVLSGEGLMGISEEDARAIMQFYLQRGKTQLVLSLYREMCAARRGGSARGGRGSNLGSGSLDVAFAWPPAGLQTTTELVLGLSQQLCIVEALQVRAPGTAASAGGPLRGVRLWCGGSPLPTILGRAFQPLGGGSSFVARRPSVAAGRGPGST